VHYAVYVKIDCVICSSVLDGRTAKRVAIKKFNRPFQSHVHARRTFRELDLLSQLQHDNVRYILLLFLLLHIIEFTLCEFFLIATDSVFQDNVFALCISNLFVCLFVSKNNITRPLNRDALKLLQIIRLLDAFTPATSVEEFGEL